MRLLYCDPGLASNLGHHANSCRAIVGEVRKRGIEVEVFAAHNADDSVRREFHARSHFNVPPYWMTDGDPICGWLTAFGVSVEATRADFRKLEGQLRPDDLLYLNSGQAAQLMALATWMATSPLPMRAAIEFGTDPGLDLKVTAEGITATVRDPRADARGVFWRFASKQVTPAILSRLRMVTFDPASSDVYGRLMDRPVGVLPVPRGRELPPRNRAPGDPVTLSVLGHQRKEKGYGFVPDVFAELGRRFPDGRVRFLAHNGQPDLMTDVQQAMRRLAASDSRVELDERVADAAIWRELLHRSDLIVCPYVPDRFAISYSAVASEAIANGIPLVVPAGTTLQRSMDDFGAGTAFTQWNPDEIVRAIEQAILSIDALTARAAAGAEKWAMHHGPGRCVDELLRSPLRGV
jgi:glycosyltransferase involved in cell wall biosynthesis